MTSSSIGLPELPPEILEQILQNVPTLHLLRCRRVCSKWRDVIDSMARGDEFWRQRCARDHPTVYQRARAKCSPNLTWQQLHRSLSLWPKLNTVHDPKCIKLYTSKTLLDDSDDVNDISAVQGRVNLHQSDEVLFYSVKGRKTGAFSDFGVGIGFEEVENVRVYTLIGIFNSVLCIIKKVNGKLDSTKVVIENATNFVIVNDDVYYEKCDCSGIFIRRGTDVHIYVTRARDDYKTSVKLRTFEGEDIITFGVWNNVPALMTESNAIYVLEDNTFVFKEFFIDYDDNPSLMVKTYNFLLCSVIRRALTKEVGYVVQAYCSYEDLMFLGDSAGVLKVYNTAELISCALECKPIAEYNVTEMLQFYMDHNPVTGIDVIEKENGHFILVSVCKGAVAIEISHGIGDSVYMHTRSRKRAVPKTYNIMRAEINNKRKKKRN